MHHRLLRIALALLVLATGSSIAGPRDQWFTIPYNGVTGPPGPPYMVTGGWENGHDLYVCRAAVGNFFVPGKTWTGLNGCFVAAGPTGEMLVTPYQVLPQPPFVSNYFVYRWATNTEMITNPDLWNLAVQGGIDPTQSTNTDYQICSSDLSVNGTYVGRHPGRLIGRYWCLVTWGGQFYFAQDWGVLLYANP